jgi:hypothetical protein
MHTWSGAIYAFESLCHTCNMRQVLPVVPAKQNPHYLIFKSCKSFGWLKRNFTYFCGLFRVYCSTMQGCPFHLLKQARPWMFANLKIICQFHAHSVHQNSVEIFRAEIYRRQLFLGPNLVSFNRTLVISWSLRRHIVRVSPRKQKVVLVNERFLDHQYIFFLGISNISVRFAGIIW